MRATWEALKQSLVRSTGTLSATSQFNQMKTRHRSLEQFSSTGQLVSFLNADTVANGERDEKDRIYRSLIEVVQAGDGGSEVATALLWLGLWPGLDAIYRRRQRDFVKEPAALVSEIGALFTAVIHRSNLDRINRVAATLVRNVERDVRESLRRQWADAARHATLPSLDEDGDDEDEGSTGDLRRTRQSRHLRTRGVSDLGQPPRLDFDADIGALRELLRGIVGDDTDLVIGAAIYGESQREVGERLRLTHEAARKRWQRALKRLHQWTQKN
jgi:RNA polymerase sigma-70 factor (ECF subfamily)